MAFASGRTAAAALKERLSWRGPLLTTAGDPDHVIAMSRTATYLFLVGGVIAFVSLLLPHPGPQRTVELSLVAGAAIAAAAAHLIAFYRTPPFAFHVSTLFGSFLVTAGAFLAGSELRDAYAAFYLWVVVYAFFFFSLRGAAVHLGAVVAGYVAVLVASGDLLSIPVYALLELGTLGVAGAIVTLLKTRLQRVVGGLEESERQLRAEAARHAASRERFSTLVHELDAIVWEGAADGSGLSFISKRAEELLGYPVEQWLEDPDFWASKIHPDDRGRIEAYWRGETANARDHEHEYRMIAADGRVVWFRDKVRVIVGEDGGPDELRGVMVDVTAYKEAETRLREAQKMEAVGQLAGGIAHDFNNLLTAINGYSELALARTNGHDDDLRKELTEIRRAGEQAASLTRQLLAYSRRQVLQPRVLDLNQTVRDLERMLRRLIGEDVEIVTSLDPGLSRTTADAAQVQQALINLVVNARDAMPNGGTIEIRTANVELDEAFVREHPAARAGEFVMLSVSDDGTGMDEVTARRIFEPFFTTKEPGRGTGLGLATVEGIVRQSGGCIAVTSAPNEGSTFALYLPRTGATDEEDVADAAPTPAGAETILLVEDEDVVRELTRKMLELSGYRVTAVGAPTDAAAIGDLTGPFDLLVTDVVMPTMNGRELAEVLCSRWPQLKVLYVSGYPRQVIAERGVLEDTVRFLQKPFTHADLAATVRATLDR